MESWGYEWLPKAILYALVQVAAGLVVVRWLVARAWVERRAPASDLERWFSNRAVLVASAIVLGLLVRAWTHTMAAFGLPDALAWESIRLVAVESRWGASWKIQCFAALALLAASFMIRAPRWGWPAYACGVLALCGVKPLLGHAAGSPSRHAIHAIHLVAGAMWLGSLAVLVAMRLTGVAPRLIAGRAEQPLEGWFSPIALTAAVLVGSSGLVAAWLYVGAAEHLFSTTYGRLLLVKVITVCAVVACGWLNWQRVRVGAEPSTAVMSAEVVLALAVVVTTSVLTETEHP